MSPLELALVSMETVGANKLRSGLTMLGVAIGSMAIILLLSLSLGMNQQITGVVEGLGSNLYLVLSGRQDRGGFAQGSRPTATVNNLRLQHAEKLQKESGHQITVSPVLNVPTTISYGKTSRSGIFVMGAMPNFPKVRNWPIEQGTFVRQTDVDLTRRVVAIGKTVEADLFEGTDPLGKQVTISGERFQVIGVMGSKGQLFDVDLDNQVFIPLSTAQRVFGANVVSLIFVHVPRAEDIPVAVAEAKQILVPLPRQRRLYGEKPGGNAGGVADDRHHPQHYVGEHRQHLVAGRRHRHHEHHDRLSGRAHTRDRPSQSLRGPRLGNSPAVFERIDTIIVAGEPRGDDPGVPGRGADFVSLSDVCRDRRAFGHGTRDRFLDGGRDFFWCLPCF